MMSSTYRTYRVRYSKFEAILCVSMILIVGFGLIYIIGEGFSNRDIDDTTDNDNDVTTTPSLEELSVLIDLYSDSVADMSGSLTIKQSDGTVYQVLTVDANGIVIEDILLHTKGIYSISYQGTNNDIVFGPIEYDVQNVGMLLVDDLYFGIRITVRTGV